MNIIATNQIEPITLTFAIAFLVLSIGIFIYFLIKFINVLVTIHLMKKYPEHFNKGAEDAIDEERSDMSVEEIRDEIYKGRELYLWMTIIGFLMLILGIGLLLNAIGVISIQSK